MAQGTVKHFDPKTRSGSVLLDDGTEIAIPADAFDGTVGDQQQIRSIGLVTMSRG